MQWMLIVDECSDAKPTRYIRVSGEPHSFPGDCLRIIEIAITMGARFILVELQKVVIAVAWNDEEPMLYDREGIMTEVAERLPGVNYRGVIDPNKSRANISFDPEGHLI